MLLAGIDEAGYGPRLGPLTVGAAAFRAPDVAQPPPAVLKSGPAASGSTSSTTCTGEGACTTPDPASLWNILAPAVRRPGERGGRERILLGDSKLVYSTARGVGGLERGVLAFLSLLNNEHVPSSAGEALGALLPPGDIEKIAGLPWYSAEGESFPLAAEVPDIAAAAERLGAALRENEIAFARLGVRALTAGVFNAGIKRTDNKATVLWETVASHLAELRALGSRDGGLSVTVDRLGGRKDYIPLLAESFPDAMAVEERGECVAQAPSPVQVRESGFRPSGAQPGATVPHGSRRAAGGAGSAYTLAGGGPATALSFCEKADRDFPAVALASMAAKYVREILMARFNRWWCAKLPGLRPTAGYPVDAARWLAETADIRKKLGVGDAGLVRVR